MVKLVDKETLLKEREEKKKVSGKSQRSVTGAPMLEGGADAGRFSVFWKVEAEVSLTSEVRCGADELP